jgi:hypothetical protein
MSQRFGSITAALTGQLTFILIISATLALVASYLILRLFRRAVVTSMQRRSRNELFEPKGYLAPDPEHKPNDAPLSFNFVTRDAADTGKRAALVYQTVAQRRRRTALIHIIAGGCFAAAMTTAILWAAKMDFAPIRFLYLTWVNAWPAVLAVDLAVGLSRRGRLIGAAGYFLVGAIVGVSAMVKSPELPIGQLLYLWLNGNLLATLLLFIFLNRSIRAIGPLMLVFMILAVTGANLIVTSTGNHPKLLKAISDFAFSIRLGPVGTLVALQVIGFAAFAIAGWLVLGALSRLYETKNISEQSITVDAVWLLFGIVNSLELVVHGPFWILSGLVAFAFYKVVDVGLLRTFGIARRGKAGGHRLLLLRVFALGKRGETLYDTLGKSWRTVGSIQMIAGRDLAASAVEPHEFLDFVTGNFARRFVDSARTLDLRIDHMDLAPDKDGQFRVTEFFCHDDTWKITLGRLADDSDAVLMDLRGLSQANSACVFEIHELFNAVALPRIVFAVDDTTDQPFMRQTMQHAWVEMKQRSPNRRLSAGQVSLVDLTGTSAASLHNLLYGLCAAATVAPK